MLITAYNEALLETYELDLDSEILSGCSSRPFSIVTRKCSDDAIVKRRGLQMSRSSPPNHATCTSPPPRSCRSTPTTPLNRADKPGGVTGVEPPNLFNPEIGNDNDNRLNSHNQASSPVSSFSDCSLDIREPLEHSFQNIMHTREEWIWGHMIIKSRDMTSRVYKITWYEVRRRVLITLCSVPICRVNDSNGTYWPSVLYFYCTE